MGRVSHFLHFAIVYLSVEQLQPSRSLLSRWRSGCPTKIALLPFVLVELYLPFPQARALIFIGSFLRIGPTSAVHYKVSRSDVRMSV